MNCNQPVSAVASSASLSFLDPESLQVAGLPALPGGTPARRHHNPPLNRYRLPVETSLSRVGGRVDGEEEEDAEEEDEEEFDFDQVS